VRCIGRLQYLAGASAAQCYRMDQLRRWLSRSGISPMVIPAWRLRVGLPGEHVRSGGSTLRKDLTSGGVSRGKTDGSLVDIHCRSFRWGICEAFWSRSRLLPTSGGLICSLHICRLMRPVRTPADCWRYASRDGEFIHVYHTGPDACIPNFATPKLST